MLPKYTHYTAMNKNRSRNQLALSCIALITLGLLGIPTAEAASSIKLKDVIPSQSGVGTIDLFKPHDPKAVINGPVLESLRSEAGGKLIFGVDVNEAASGTEKSTSQGVAVKSVTLSVVLNGVTKTYQSIWPNNVTDCCSTETKASLLAAAGSQQRQGPYYTLIGHSGSNSITGNSEIKNIDSTLTVNIPDNLSSATSAVFKVELLQTNTSLGDPEAYYDFSGGYEDLALLSKNDATIINQEAAGQIEAPMMVQTNPPPPPDTPVSSTNYVPTASSFYFAGYEDLYPDVGDYDFNDLTVAYQIVEGFDKSGNITAIQGTAYLITRGASYSSDWHIKFDLPPGTVGNLVCKVQLKPESPAQPCSASNPSQTNGSADITVFENTTSIFTDPGSPYVNTDPGRPFVQGPKATFTLDLAAPIRASSLKPPFNAYLHVRKTGQMIQLLEVNPSFKDKNGFPFGMLMPADWQPPSERVSLIDAYPGFLDFVASQGSKSANWYKTPKADKVLGVPISTTWAW